MEEIRRGVFKLSTGVYLHANAGVIGLAESNPNAIGPDRFSLFGGYDESMIECARNEHGHLIDIAEDVFATFTLEEKIEISRFMVDRWRQWADDHGEII